MSSSNSSAAFAGLGKAAITGRLTRAAMNCLLFIVCILLSGCLQTIQTVPTEVRVPVPVPCLERSQLPQTPKVLTNQELLKLNDHDFVLELGISRTVLTQYASEQRALLEACVVPGAQFR